MEGSKGTFVSMPSYKTKDGSYKDLTFPLNKELREQIQNAVLKEYDGGFQGEDVTDDSDDTFPF